MVGVGQDLANTGFEDKDWAGSEVKVVSRVEIRGELGFRVRAEV